MDGKKAAKNREGREPIHPDHLGWQWGASHNDENIECSVERDMSGHAYF